MVVSGATPVGGQRARRAQSAAWLLFVSLSGLTSAGEEKQHFKLHGRTGALALPVWSYRSCPSELGAARVPGGRRHARFWMGTGSKVDQNVCRPGRVPHPLTCSECFSSSEKTGHRGSEEEPEEHPDGRQCFQSCLFPWRQRPGSAGNGSKDNRTIRNNGTGLEDGSLGSRWG